MICRRWYTQLLAAALLIVSSGVTIGQELRLELSALYWKRGHNSGDFDYFAGATNDSLVPSEDLLFNYEFGNRVKLTYEGCMMTIDGSYTRLDNWVSSTDGAITELDFDLAAPSIGAVMNFVTGISAAAVQEEEALGATRINTSEALFNNTWRASHESRYQDADVNFRWRLPIAHWLRMGFGFRWAQLNESFGLGILGTFDDAPLGDNLSEELRDDSLTNPGVNPANVNNTVVGGGLTLVSGVGTNTGFQGDTVGGAAAPASIIDMTFDANVTNMLIGGQLVFDATFVETCYFVIEGSAKVGCYWNHITSELTENYREVNNDLSEYEGGFEATKNTVAFLGNFNLTAGYKLRENIRIKLGYELQILSGVALAANQWQNVANDNFGIPNYDVRTNDWLMFHGGNASLEVMW